MRVYRLVIACIFLLLALPACAAPESGDLQPAINNTIKTVQPAAQQAYGNIQDALRQEENSSGATAAETPRPMEMGILADAVESAINAAVSGVYAVHVYDFKQQSESISFNADRQIYAASLAKLPIAEVLYNLADSGELSLEETRILRESDIVPGTGTIQGEAPGTTYTYRELSRRMLSHSDNVAANMIIEYIGTDRLGVKLGEMGLSNTVVERKYFDAVARDSGHDIHTTARDMGLSLRLLFTRDWLSDQASDEILSALENQDDHSKIPAGLKGYSRVWNKTGAIDGMEHDAAVVVTSSSRSYSLVVMSEELANNQDGITTIREIARIVNAFMS